MSSGNGVVGSLVYKFSERVAVKMIALVIGIVLARLIEPESFGLLAILTVFINLSNVFVVGGLNIALVQNKETKEEDYSTVFWISLLVAVLIYIGMFFAAPLIADYYENHELLQPLRVISIGMLFAAFNSIQTAKLSREMQFKKQMVCSLIATVTAGIVGIFMAYRGFGLWALVAYNLLSQAAACVAMLLAAKWWPKLCFSFSRAKILVGYGWKILLSNILYSIYSDARALIIGKVYTTADLALYDRANQFPFNISYNLETALQAVMLPVLAKEQDNMSALKERLSKMMRAITFVITPLMVGLAAVARPFVLALLTDKWEACIPYLMIFSIGYIFLPISGCCNVSIKAIGRSDVFAKSQAVRIGTLFIAMLVSVFAFHSVLAIVIGYGVSLVLECLIALWPVRKYIGYGFADAAKDVYPCVLASAIMGGVVFAVCELIRNPFVALVCGIGAGAAVYLFWALICKPKAFREALELLHKHK